MPKATNAHIWWRDGEATIVQHPESGGSTRISDDFLDALPSNDARATAVYCAKMRAAGMDPHHGKTDAQAWLEAVEASPKLRALIGGRWNDAD